ncbi:MAG: ketoacyl-ACP synthase III [Bacteroidia bacterium]|nr:ketoacyl-ACP synthase III [Bacteroidia bacterium]
MAIFSFHNVKFSGVSGAIPLKEISNSDYKWISAKERDLLIKTTGVEKRRVVPGFRTITTSDLCFSAAEKLLYDLKWDKNEIDLLIFISQSRDYSIPQTSAILQDRLGLPHSCMTLDISLGCSAYVYGLSVICGLMQSGTIRKSLLLVGDISSLGTSYRDKSAYPLFGDAGTASAFQYEPSAPAMHFNLMSDGSGYDAIIMPDAGMRNWIDRKKSFEYKKYGTGIYRTKLNLHLDGIKVFNFSLREVAPNVKELLKVINKTVEEADYVVLHQANKLINEVVRKKLKVPEDKFPYTIHKFGNTSCASIPLTIASELQTALRMKHANLLLSGFGVGLSWGSVWMETDKLVVSDIIEM